MVLVAPGLERAISGQIVLCRVGGLLIGVLINSLVPY
jgi:hypothetical protein